ncbi:hypothetical protein [Streptomyces sp. NPDC085479]|uniref:hypothetical protein n=1 Tax=Streptomyces sp. NPDC085479 TaxID=3365726 RepID=UPI0037CDD354
MDLHLEPPHAAGPVRLGIGVEVHLEEDDRVTAVEFWWPGEGRTSTTRVLLGGRDVVGGAASYDFRLR